MVQVVLFCYGWEVEMGSFGIFVGSGMGELLCCMAGVTRGRDLCVGIAASGDLPSSRSSTERGSSPK